MTSYRVVATMNELEPFKFFEDDESRDNYLSQNKDGCHFPEVELCVPSKDANIMVCHCLAAGCCYFSTGSFQELKSSCDDYYRDFNFEDDLIELTTTVSNVGNYRKTIILDLDDLAIFEIFEFLPDVIKAGVVLNGEQLLNDGSLLEAGVILSNGTFIRVKGSSVHECVLTMIHRGELIYLGSGRSYKPYRIYFNCKTSEAYTDSNSEYSLVGIFKDISQVDVVKEVRKICESY